MLVDGRVLGTLCVFSEQPGELSEAQLAALTDLAGQAVALFEQARLTRLAAAQAAAAELARKEAERRSALTAAVLDTIDVGIVACDAAGRLTLFNRAAREFHGAPEDPTVESADWARTYSLFAEGSTTPLAEEAVPLVRALRNGEVHDALLVIAPPSREPVTVRCDGRAMHDASGALLDAVLAQKDVTEARSQARALTEARDAALAATRAKTAFLAATSHEIRTPLNGVLGMLEVLAHGQLTPRQREYVGVAHRSGEALLHLLNDVLDLSKAETTAVSLVAAPFTPGDVAAEVVAALEPVARGKGLVLQLRCQDQQLLVGDAARLRQVLMNLIGNAVKFTDAGHVRVAVALGPANSADRSRLQLTIADTGAGMCAGELDQLFQPFTQGAQGQRLGGTGLGLALSQQLVELMGGQITVSSSPGLGATFTVRVDLPRAEPAGPHPGLVPATAPYAAVPGEPARPRLRVLVADDNEINLMVAQAFLEQDGVEVTTVDDGGAAVQAVEKASFDLVLLDMQMSRMSGLEAARAIRELPGRAGRTRLIALTANSGDDDQAACAAAGMEGFLVKPLRRQDLKAALAGE